ncbi:hypothetical protein [Rummeliibacillus stabekisii]|nr:hypothetical protein [Rummeliibacillus stabekisii]
MNWDNLKQFVKISFIAFLLTLFLLKLHVYLECQRYSIAKNKE